MMAETSYPVRRTNPRFSFFADGEITLLDGTSVLTQLSELSSRGCYVGTLEPIPTGTELQLCIRDGRTSCELPGQVIYMHSGGGLGIFGLGVVFGKMSAEQKSAIDKWLRELAVKQSGSR
jgi:PilZ domain-containing protein